MAVRPCIVIYRNTMGGNIDVSIKNNGTEF